MRKPSLAEVVDRWTLAHTIAVVAWIVAILVACVLMVLKVDGKSFYPRVDTYKTYAAENATFTYPDNWIINNCNLGKPFIEIPGNMGSRYRGRGDVLVTIYGISAYRCIKDRPERLDIYSEDIIASGEPCLIATSTKGEKLDNGLYVQLKEQEDKVVAIHITQNSCFAPSNTVVLGFAFKDPEASDQDLEEFGTPGVNKEDLLGSPQYQDIKTLASSIKY